METKQNLVLNISKAQKRIEWLEHELQMILLGSSSARRSRAYRDYSRELNLTRECQRNNEKKLQDFIDAGITPSYLASLT